MCNHEEAEQDVALVDGMCPLCLAADLAALNARVEKMAAVLQWIYDEGEGGAYRPDIQAVLVAHNQAKGAE